MTVLRIITRPTNMSVVDWANNVASDLRVYGIVGSLASEDQWQEWGAQICNNPSITTNVPNPYQFSDWKDWANRLCDSLA